MTDEKSGTQSSRLRSAPGDAQYIVWGLMSLVPAILFGIAGYRDHVWQELPCSLALAFNAGLNAAKLRWHRD
jgi:hypothetical protein